MREPSNQKASIPRAERDGIDEAAQDWFLLLSSGEPTEADRVRFRAWRDADPRHRAAYDELRELWADVDDLRDAFAQPGARSPTGRQRGDNGQVIAARRRRPALPRRQAVWAGLAAACIALLLIGLPDMATRIMADHWTGVGEQTRVDLPDGSIAWLNTDSAISVSYGEDHRRIALLRGEAQFEVARDAARPFAVMAHEGRSTALGTIFVVRDDGTGALVTVAEGTVEVASPVEEVSGSASMAGTALLNPGDQVRYAEGAPPGPVRRVEPSTVTAWRDGFIAIRDLPLADALSEIDRYRPGRIVLLANTASLETVTARLSIRAIDNGLAALAATHGLTVTRLTDYLVLVR